MTELHSEEEVTAIVKEMIPTTESSLEQEGQTTITSLDKEEEQATVDLGIKADVPEEQVIKIIKNKYNFKLNFILLLFTAHRKTN